MELKASQADAGERLDAFLAVPLGSRARAQRLIEAGAVLVDGAAVPKRHRIAAGEVVVIDEDAEQLPVGDPSQTAEFTVAFEDEHLLVIDKPAGVVVHPARGHWHGTLAQGLAEVRRLSEADKTDDGFGLGQWVALQKKREYRQSALL
jgi:23S rRNA pseudouridine1911/1915/1917 synthase